MYIKLLEIKSVVSCRVLTRGDKLKKFKNRLKSNEGFMGATHILSAVSIFFFIVAVFPDFLFGQLGSKDVFVVFSSLIIVGGASLLPDLDNTKSSAISSLGIIGIGLSKAMRALAVVIYTLTRTRYDDENVNPHRGFWHTIISVILLFFVVLASVSIDKAIMIFNNEYTIGFLFFSLWLFICSRLFFTTFFKKSNDRFKRKGTSGSIISLLLSVILTVCLVMFTSHLDSYRWVAFSMATGYLIHIIGDTFTVAGTPLFWPIKRKGKRWYTYRFLKIKAGGDVEKYIFLPGFFIISVISIAKTLMMILST